MKVLILGGGSSKNSWQCGVLKYLTEIQGKSWDLISGVSAGALNAAIISQYAPSEQHHGVKRLEEIWRSIGGSSSIYKTWLPSPIPSILSYITSFWTKSLFSTNPLKKLIKNNFSHAALQNSGVKLMVGAVSLTTGKCHFAREDDPKLLDWIVASSAYPVVFPPVKINGNLYIDGGMRKNVSPLALILEEFIPTEIDIILTSPINSINNDSQKVKGGALGVAIRTVQILNEEIFPSALIASCLEKGIKVNIFAPEESLKVDLLNFSPTIISCLIDKGYNDTFRKYVTV